MPIFEFLCTSCAGVFEKIVYDDTETLTCPKCGSTQLTKLLSAPSSLSGVKQEGRLPGHGDTGCCGSNPSSKGCIPGSCCGRAHS